MAKQDALKISGTVIECLPGAMFRVKVADIKEPVLTYISGKIRLHHINICLGDVVDIEISPYDLTKGRLVYRHA